MLMKIVLCISVVLLISSSIVLWRACVNYKTYRKRADELMEENEKLKKDIESERSKYSEDILKYVRTFTTQITILKFREFIDTHDIEKVNEANIKGLVEDVARNVHDSIKEDRILFDELLFTKLFYESYIIDITVSTIKDLLNKSVEEY